jgi:hypothetical protein
VFTSAAALSLFVILFPAFYLLIQYIAAMGFTQRRVVGIIYALGGFCLIAAMVFWVAWPPKKTM